LDDDPERGSLLFLFRLVGRAPAGALALRLRRPRREAAAGQPLARHCFRLLRRSRIDSIGRNACGWKRFPTELNTLSSGTWCQDEHIDVVSFLDKYCCQWRRKPGLTKSISVAYRRRAVRRRFFIRSACACCRWRASPRRPRKWRGGWDFRGSVSITTSGR